MIVDYNCGIHVIGLLEEYGKWINGEDEKGPNFVRMLITKNEGLRVAEFIIGNLLLEKDPEALALISKLNKISL